jgi:protein involved in polysaccharide export with SLBB domain
MLARLLTFTTLFLVLPRIGVGAEAPEYVIEPPDILQVEVFGLPKKAQSIQGQHLVRPDGTVSLGDYGSVSVSGLSPDQAEAVIAKHLAGHAKKKRKLEARVDVVAYNSKVYYIIVEGAQGSDHIHRHPLRCGETVAASVLAVEGLAAAATKGRIWLTREPGKVLNVDWRAITQEGRLATNYKLEPGDRLWVGSSRAK